MLKETICIEIYENKTIYLLFYFFFYVFTGKLYAVSGKSKLLDPIGMIIELGRDENGRWSYEIASFWSPKQVS